MRNKLLLYAICACALALSNLTELIAGDTLTVQTLTFDSITTRRGVWKFPVDPSKYSKILMLHTLKCDPSTVHDNYNCGEWDYLTYNIVHEPTGVFKTNTVNYKKYRVGVAYPDTIPYFGSPFYDVKQIARRSAQITKVNSEKAFSFDAPGSAIIRAGKAGKVQFIITKDALLAKGLAAGKIAKIKIPVGMLSGAKNEFTIRIKKSLSKVVSALTLVDDAPYYSGYFNAADSLNPYFLLSPAYDWDGKSNLLIEIAYDLDEGSSIKLASASDAKSVIAVGGDHSLNFDATGDWADLGSKPEVDALNKFTAEGAFKFKELKDGGRIFDKGDAFNMRIGPNGAIILTLGDASYASYGIAKGAAYVDSWMHIAYVFDGSKATNDEKLKLYVNGKPVKLDFKGTIRNYTPASESHLTISSAVNGSANLLGAADNVRFWSDALSENALNSYMNKPLDASHPNNASLIASYDMEEEKDHKIKNGKTGEFDGILVGAPDVHAGVSGEISGAGELLNSAPAVELYQGDYEITYSTTVEEKQIPVAPITIEELDSDNSIVVRKNIIYAYPARPSVTIDTNGVAHNGDAHAATTTLYNETKNYQSKPYQVYKDHEIGRYITPYGIGLDLGPTGFTWTFDVTDYAPYLKGDVELSAGNWQELIDLKFLFIEGEQPREVNKIDHVWGDFRSISYKDLSDGTAVRDTTIQLAEGTKSAKIKFRLTGHGHNSNDGSFPHCCEWKNNDHMLYVDGEKRYSFKIFLDNDCANNPVFPQGGTWPGAREGWCPGDKVKDYEFDLTPYIKNGAVTVGYKITPVPQDNPGMGGGNYIFLADLIEYKETKNENDVEIIEVVRPNADPYYSRLNPFCGNPWIEIRNAGSKKLTSAKFQYNPLGGSPLEYVWTGSLEPFSKELLELPIESTLFWSSGDKKKFEVKALQANGVDDENLTNNRIVADARLHDFYNEKLFLVVQMNQRQGGQGYSYKVTDASGNSVVQNNALSAGKLYRHELNFQKGCYTFQFDDEYHYGLSYWAFPDQGSGSVRIENASGKVVKTFNSDFGAGIHYAFEMGDFNYVEDANAQATVTLFPNPTAASVRFNSGEFSGVFRIEIYNEAGSLALVREINANANQELEIPTAALFPGTYSAIITVGENTIYRKFIKN
ncbi:MAG: LamG-like jellyroll fold domain-containing protein [Chloroflexota bacterium]